MGFPKISIKSVCNTVSDIAEKGAEVFNNMVDDHKFFFNEIKDCVTGCGANLDQIRLRSIHRDIEYLTGSIETLTKYGIIPTELIHSIYNLVADDIKRDPKPKIYHFDNIRQSLYSRIETPNLVEINPYEFEPEEGHESWVFIHGMLYKAINKDGADFSRTESLISFPEIDNKATADALDFYCTFEYEVNMFKDNDPPINIYLVSYDSESDKNIKDIIEKFIIAEAINYDIGSTLFLLSAGVFWYEMERRAKITGDYILPFINKLKGNDGKAITHSLGCYVLAHAGQKIHHRDNMGASFREWWCMSAALPSNAFTNTGDFKNAPFITMQYDNREYRTGTLVMYSMTDLVLAMLYPLANYHPALGQTGALVEKHNMVHDVNITNIVHRNHGFAGKYIEELYSNLLGHYLQDPKYPPEYM